jgi:hypothetical protein
MAMPRKLSVDFGMVFPQGAFAVSEVTQVRDFDRSTKDKPVYSVDEETGFSIWSVDVMDGDREARRADKTVTVKILAMHQPVLPEAPAGLPITPVEFTGLTATPYISDSNGRPRLAWSYRALAVMAPKNAGAPSSSKSAA